MDSDYCDNEYGYGEPVPVENGLPLYGGGDHSGPARPDVDKAKDTLQLGSAPFAGNEFTKADLPR